MDEVILPFEVLDKIARHCPRALETYLHVFMRVDNGGQAMLSREVITEELGLSFTKFCNDLRCLTKEDVLKWHKGPNGVMVILADV